MLGYKIQMMRDPFARNYHIDSHLIFFIFSQLLFCKCDISGEKLCPCVFRVTRYVDALASPCNHRAGSSIKADFSFRIYLTYVTFCWPGACFNRNTIFPGVGIPFITMTRIPIMKIRRLGTRAPSEYPKRCLSVRSRKVSKPRDLYLKLSDRSEIW